MTAERCSQDIFAMLDELRPELEAVMNRLEGGAFQWLSLPEDIP